jgi:hypothetical protein
MKVYAMNSYPSLTLAALLSLSSAVAQERSGLSVAVSTVDARGRDLPRVRVSETFRIRIAFTEDAAARAAPALNLRPAAWLRRVTAGKPACVDAAQAFRATGRLSREDIALAGYWLLSLDSAHRLAIIDPALSNTRTNLMGLAVLEARPGGSVVSKNGRSLVVTRPERGDLLTVELPSGRTRPLVSGLGRPTDIIDGPGDTLWAGDDANGRVTAQAYGTRPLGCSGWRRICCFVANGCASRNSWALAAGIDWAGIRGK